jgi:hypothetical protein
VAVVLIVEVKVDVTMLSPEAWICSLGLSGISILSSDGELGMVSGAAVGLFGL